MFSGGRARTCRSKKLHGFMRNTQHMLIQVCCAPPVLFHIYCPTAEVQWGRMHMEGSESILSLLADPEFLREFLCHIKISWPPERLIINTKYTSLNSTEIHPFQLCFCSYFTCSWQLAGWCHVRSAFSWEQSGAAPDTSPAPAGEWWLLCLLLRGKIQIIRGKSSHCSGSQGLLFVVALLFPSLDEWKGRISCSLISVMTTKGISSAFIPHIQAWGGWQKHP